MVPIFSTLQPSEVFSPTLLSQLPRSKHKRVVDSVLHEVDELRNSCLQLFFSDTRHNTPSESNDQLTIREYESLYDQELRKFVEGIELHLMEDLASRRSSKRGSNFDRTTTGVLEAAYARASTLTHSECKIVARASGLTHQQFQNKRSREKKRTRTRSKRPAQQATIAHSHVTPDLQRYLPAATVAPDLGDQDDTVCPSTAPPIQASKPRVKDVSAAASDCNDTVGSMKGDVAACDALGAMSDWLNEAIFGSDAQYHTVPDGQVTKSVTPTEEPSEGSPNPLASDTEAIGDLAYWL
ncbi:uncharacterized protein LOC62_01G001344 [Vanrija pseudolonga]|uniref:Uncharacterized protein n=1 Tax=Vanrija pseudolonga TaxID=143232 RepID=A0AAF0Y6P6_9TREE|nr:hypothetical protein LOC62_01G001344 [Vanrija pseudolonga]